MDIQDKVQEIHHKYGITEKANYEIQLFVEVLLKEQKEQLILSDKKELLIAYEVNKHPFLPDKYKLKYATKLVDKYLKSN